VTLEQSIADVLRRLSLLSEAPSARALSDGAPPEDLPKDRRRESEQGFGRAQPKQHRKSAIPAGVQLDRDPNRPPPKDRSLHDWFLWQFDRAETRDKRLKLYFLAEQEYQRRTNPDEARLARRRGELDERDIRDGGLSEREAAKRVAVEWDWYEGMPAIQVAIIEEQSEVWVRKARREHNRNPDTGRPLPPFKEWGEDRRREEIFKCYSAGLSQQQAADHFAVSRQTVQRYWPKDQRAAA
jgi:transposase